MSEQHRVMGGEITPGQLGYLRGLLERCGYGDRVTIAWKPVLRKIGLSPGIGQRVDTWLPTLTKRKAGHLIDILRGEE